MAVTHQDLEQALAHIRRAGRASAGELNRQAGVPFRQAAAVMCRLEALGVVGPERGIEPREILVDLAMYQLPGNDPVRRLANDVARCNGSGSVEDGVQYWREGCEHCLRRTAPRPAQVWMMAPPPIIAFECEYLIEPNRPGAEAQKDK